MQGTGEPLSTQWRVNLYETGEERRRGIERAEVTERRRKRGRRRRREKGGEKLNGLVESQTRDF